MKKLESYLLASLKSRPGIVAAPDGRTPRA